jgi:hypothetical protein
MKHLKDHGMSYIEHMIFAFTYAYKLSIMSIVAMIHGILPFTFTTYVSDKLKDLKD